MHTPHNNLCSECMLRLAVSLLVKQTSQQMIRTCIINKYLSDYKQQKDQYKTN